MYSVLRVESKCGTSSHVNIPNTYLVRVGHQLRYLHINHIMRKETMNIEDDDDEVVPCQFQSQHWVLPLPVCLNQRSQNPIPEPAPITEPAAECPARNALASAQEPVSRAPAHIPVAVSESESPPQSQRQSETVLRNSRMKTGRRYPVR